MLWILTGWDVAQIFAAGVVVGAGLVLLIALILEERALRSLIR